MHLRHPFAAHFLIPRVVPAMTLRVVHPDAVPELDPGLEAGDCREAASCRSVLLRLHGGLAAVGSRPDVVVPLRAGQLRLLWFHGGLEPA